MRDTLLMRRAREYAERGRKTVHPNPMVGALVVKGTRVIASAWHQEFGKEHAEVLAIRQAGKRCNGATLFVTLEPCSTFGKTPPCTDLIIRSRIKKVVVGAVDPNPKHCGRGIRLLRKHGIAVTVGVLADEIASQNEAFFTFMKCQRPFVNVKLAMSLDGKIAAASGDSQWISSPESRHFVHELRASVDGVLVGIETCLHDHSRLSVREIAGAWREPYKIILDSSLRLPKNAAVITKNPPGSVIVITSKKCSPARIKALERYKVAVLPVREHKPGFLAIPDTLAVLAEREIASLLVEGGSAVAGSFFDARMVDKVYFFYAPKVIGGNIARSAIGGNGVAAIAHAISFKRGVWRESGPDTLFVGYPHWHKQ